MSQVDYPIGSKIVVQPEDVKDLLKGRKTVIRVIA